AASPVAVAIAGVKGIPAEEITAHATLQGELGFDSLMLTELLEALEARFGAIDPQRLQACVSVADVEDLVRARDAGDTVARRAPVRAPSAPIVLPEQVQDFG